MTYKTQSTRDIEVALRKRYPEQSHALIFQVPNGTGGNKSRTADAISFSLWPSRGLDIEGIEIKVSRSDWRKEIEDPTKAATFSKHCHRWWIATVPDVVESGEVPANWGVLELKRGVLRQKIEAPRNPEPEAIPHKMWIGVMRAVQRTELDALRRVEGDIRREVREDLEQQHNDRLKSMTKAVEDFKEATGIDVRYSQYRIDELKQALDMIREGQDYSRLMRTVGNLGNQLRRVADDIDAAVQND